MAKKILSIQRAAGLDEKLVRQSALSVVMAQEPRHRSAGHTAWVEGYEAEVRQRVPGFLPELERSPEWYQINPHDPERDGPEPEPEPEPGDTGAVRLAEYQPVTVVPVPG